MSNLNDFATGLVDEVLSEMAGNFFGARKRMDELLERYEALVKELGSMQGQAERAAEILHYLLGSEENVVFFYESIGMDPDELPLCLSCKIAPVVERFPRALTRKGRFIKLVLATYDQMQQALDSYMHGRHEPHEKQPERMVLSLNYNQVRRFAERINETIEKMNQEMSASCVIRYAKDLSDPTLADRERVTGAQCVPDPRKGAEGIDEEFSYALIDFDMAGLKEFPKLPPLHEVSSQIKRVCSTLYSRDKAAIDNTMTALKKARDEQ